MIEAKIICSVPCDIPDLNIYGMMRGEERWVSDLAASQSSDLVKEQRKGNVRVFRQTRRTPPIVSPKRHLPPFVAHSRPALVERSEVVERPQVIERPSGPDADDIARRVRTELLSDLLPGIKAAIAEEVGKAVASQKPPETPQDPAPSSTAIDSNQLEAVLESVMRRVMPSVAVATQQRAPSKEKASEDSKEPLFIPTTIVDKEAKGRVSVKSQTSDEVSDIDDANALLREMNTRRNRGRTDGDQEKK